MFVVDPHALQPIHVLNFFDDVLGQLADAFKAEDVVGIFWPIRHNLTFFDMLTLKHRHVAPLGYQHLVVIITTAIAISF